MEIKNRLFITTRQEFRSWLSANAETQSECWVEAKRGIMTTAGEKVLPDLDKKMEIDSEIIATLQKDKQVWENFNSFPPLYRHVRIDKIQNKLRRKRKDGYNKMLAKFIEAIKQGIMINEWNDNGRLLNY